MTDTSSIKPSDDEKQSYLNEEGLRCLAHLIVEAIMNSQRETTRRKNSKKEVAHGNE